MPRRNPDHDLFRASFQAPPPSSAGLGERAWRSARAPGGPTEAGDEHLGEWLDDALAAWPVAPRPDFERRLFTRLRRGEASPRPAWFLVASLAAGLAACLALVLAVPTEDSVRPGPDAALSLPLDPEAAQLLVWAENLRPPARSLLDDQHRRLLAHAAK